MSTLGQWIAMQAYGPTYVLRFPILLLDVFFVLFFLPSVVTFIISHYCERGRRVINIALRPLALIGTVIAFVMLIISNWDWFVPLVISWTYVAGPCSISIIGYAIGFVVAIVVGRMPVDKAATFSAQSGVANVVFAVAMSSAMLPEPDNSVAYVPGFLFGVTSLIIGFILVPVVSVCRRLIGRYWPSKFSMASTNRRLRKEDRQRVRQEQKLRRTISVVSVSDYQVRKSISEEDDYEIETVSNADLSDWNMDVEDHIVKSISEAPVDTKVSIDGDKW
jgi:hypothetical protein